MTKVTLFPLRPAHMLFENNSDQGREAGLRGDIIIEVALAVMRIPLSAGLREEFLMPERPRAPQQRGFSILEILIVVGIAMVVTAMAAPLMMNVRNNYRMQTSTVDLNTLLQRARMQAVRDNRTYQIGSEPVTQGGVTYTRVFIDFNQDGTWTPAGPGTREEPVVQMQSGVTVSLGTTTGGNPTVPNSTLGFAPQGAGVLVRFSGRGTPCYVNVAGVCSSWGPVVAGQANPVGFVYYVQSTFASATTLAAIAIAPSGRFQVWSYDSHTQTWHL